MVVVGGGGGFRPVFFGGGGFWVVFEAQVRPAPNPPGCGGCVTPAQSGLLSSSEKAVL